MVDLIKQAKEFYPTYLLHHQHPTNRRLHLIGNILTLLFLIWCITTAPSGLLLLPFTPLIIYPLAWHGHKRFEKNEPATWHVSWKVTKLCDWIMMIDIIKRKLTI